MHTLKTFLVEKSVQTQKGSTIKRSKWHVGKLIGGNLYLHRKYVKKLPKELQQQVTGAARRTPGIRYNVVKISMNSPDVTFINSPDFDVADEPTVGTWTKVSENGVKTGQSNAIWHHKWLWVMDDYRGFDVDESFKRSQAWLTIPDIDFARIGNKELWKREYVPQIEKIIVP